MHLCKKNKRFFFFYYYSFFLKHNMLSLTTIFFHTTHVITHYHVHVANHTGENDLCKLDGSCPEKKPLPDNRRNQQCHHETEGKKKKIPPWQISMAARPCLVLFAIVRQDCVSWRRDSLPEAEPPYEWFGAGTESMCAATGRLCRDPTVWQSTFFFTGITG